ncbi:MAG: hypothetical protein HXX08_22760 [Chloroflexi bacterium]|uniref:Uncharacterized protein n=1 Tax=Candidatus Chlorohelix allophototropha TaxID=3003348 RepID=A0A8T7M9T2_9CHLR|nr:hypothetical protein [Chloroflexota bacterium]WJW68623.1 hypothetical protein OZ401_004237 [Chloroflexota bacterium L227-S17]
MRQVVSVQVGGTHYPARIPLLDRHCPAPELDVLLPAPGTVFFPHPARIVSGYPVPASGNPRSIGVIAVGLGHIIQ